MRLILFLTCISLFSCTRKTTTSVVTGQNLLPEKQIQVSPQTLQVIKTQELFGDELVLVGAIGIIEGDKINPVQVFSSYLGKVKKGQVIRLDTIKSLMVRLKPGQKASIQLSLFELEDYQQTKKWVNRFNSVSGVLAIPLALSSTENPIAWFLWGMKAGSFGLDWLSELDMRDLLGVSETQWDYDSVRSTTRKGKWIGGRQFIDAYEYQYAIQINVE
jgi:hypothetical protein